MSKLVQKSKRSLELPLGCKDLIDVDSIRNWSKLDRPDWPKRTLDQLAYMEGYLAGLLQSAGKTALVCVGRSENRGTIMVVPASDLPGSVVFAMWNSAAQEQALRAVFDEARISPLVEPVGRYKANKCLKYPPPPGPSDAARFLGGLFRAGYGLEDLAPITLWHHEPKATQHPFSP